MKIFSDFEEEIVLVLADVYLLLTISASSKFLKGFCHFVSWMDTAVEEASSAQISIILSKCTVPIIQLLSALSNFSQESVVKMFLEF